MEELCDIPNESLEALKIEACTTTTTRVCDLEVEENKFNVVVEDEEKIICESEEVVQDMDHKKAGYLFQRTLGAGSFGVVKRAKQLHSDEDVAVKILLKRALEKNGGLEPIYDELNIIQHLDHPNIVKFKDWFETESKFYIVTQLASGGELFDRIMHDGKYTEEDAVNIVVQILKAVEYLHSQNIIHRDLKPENLLYLDKSKDSRIVLADFGIARQLENDDDVIYRPAGSLGYVAPEVFTSDGHGKPSDIWSVGVITYTLLCGYSPFKAESVDGFLDEVTSDENPVKFQRPYWDGISELAKNFILRILDLDPACRPSATELLNDPWIQSKCSLRTDLYHNMRKNLSAKKKLQKAVELIKLNQRIKKLRQLYLLANETDSDLEEEERSSSASLSSLPSSQSSLSLSNEYGSKSQREQDEFISSLRQQTLAQIIKVATVNKDTVRKFEK